MAIFKVQSISDYYQLRYSSILKLGLLLHGQILPGHFLSAIMWTPKDITTSIVPNLVSNYWQVLQVTMDMIDTRHYILDN